MLRKIISLALSLLLFVLMPIRVRADDYCARAEVDTSHVDGRAFDAADGRDPRQYPPDPQVDYTHLKLDLRMSDPMRRSFECVETLSFKTPGREIDKLVLDAVDLDIKSVLDGSGKEQKFHYDDQKLIVSFDPKLPPGTEAQLVIEYACVEPTDGMIFAVPDEAYRDRPLMVHTQGQTETNRHWFISHDYPNERFTSELIATVPSRYSVLSNGAMVEKTEAGDGLTRWHYKLSKPHVSYLVSLVIGEFDIVTEKWREIPVEYWVPPGQGKRAPATFQKTTKMLDLFSRLSGTDYPYEKYAQAVVYLFNSGGMENTSTTTLHEMSVLDERALLDQDLEGLIAHELAHQWYGDMITCKSWAHIWLNEGFATYFSHLWTEYEHGQDEYDDDIWHTMRDVADASKPDSTGGIVWFYYDNSWETFRRRGNNAYSKGASVLHMLRQSLGDELFFNCIAEYTKRHAWKQVETDDLRKVIEELSGRSYEQFFQQWVYRSGAPQVRASYEWDPQTSEARIKLEQTQKVVTEMPAFIFDVPVWLVSGDRIDRHVIHMDDREASATIRCDAEPEQAVIDPNGAVLMKLELDVPSRLLINQAKSGPTTMARLSAIAALGKQHRAASRRALREILEDEESYWGIRAEAATSLGSMQSDAAMQILLESLAENRGIKDHEVRRATVAALGTYRDDRAVPTLIRFAKSDPSYAVEAVASRGLGNQRGSDEIVAVLLENARKTSWRDQIRTAAVEALAALADERGIEPAMQLAAYGQPFRSRPAGISALGQLGRDLSGERRREIRDALVKLMRDPQRRSARAAIEALGELGDERAIDELQRFADSAAPQELRKRAQTSIDSIRDKGGESSTVRGLRERIEAIEKQRRRGGDDALEAKPAPTTSPTTAPAT